MDPISAYLGDVKSHNEAEVRAALSPLALLAEETGVAVVIIETVFTATDPPIKALRRILPPIPLGPIRLDLSLMIVMLVVIIAMNVVNGLRADAVADSLATAVALARS